MKKNLEMIMIAMLLVGVGFVCGWLGFLMFGDIAKNCQVAFVSKEAIISLEEKRIKNDSKENSMFFGKTKEAFDHMEAIANSFSSKKTKVIFLSTNSGSVRNGIAISDTVHEELIKFLSQPQK